MERPPIAPPRALERRFGKARLSAERSGLLDAARGKAGQWMAAAMLALSAQGCAAVAETVRDTTVRVDFAMQPPQADTGRPREGYVVATAYERTSDDRGDLLRVNDVGEDIVVTDRLDSHWMEEMAPGRSYVGTDGHRYVAVDFAIFGDSSSASDPGAHRVEQAWSERLGIPCRVVRRAERENSARGGSERRRYYLLRSVQPVAPET